MFSIELKSGLVSMYAASDRLHRISDALDFDLSCAVFRLH